MHEFSLDQAWSASVSAQPRYVAGILRLEAEEFEARALARERWPDLSLEAGGDYGQRARPGEERDQGISARGEILARVNWNLFESGRAARERAVALRREGVRESNAAFDHAFRAEVARTYVSASLALERREHLLAARREFLEIAEVARRRMREGVEPGAAREHLEQAEAAWAARWREADTAAETARLQLALLADRTEVQPLPIRLSSVPEASPGDSPPPALAALRLQAGERRAQAEAVASGNRWRLDAIGQAGPYFSRAFDGRTEEEYYAGLRFSWSPDASGVQRARALAETRRARALEAEEAALKRDLARRDEEVRGLFRDLSSQAEEWDEAVKGAEATERAVRLRWREGVTSWRALLDERERLLSARLGELAWRERLALLLVDYAESAAALDELPVWIGQTERILP
ncbi:MAG: TolC family protein [Opitutales bacterium]|nr:TolC family protein [Opitutales bacterium]